MNKIGVVFFAIVYSWIATGQTVEIRNLYVTAVDDKETAEMLLDKLEKMESSALISGYTGAVKMLMARHVFNPFKKLSHFNEGKKMLESAIEKSPDCLELRYLRYGMQKHTPKFLNYNKSLDEDKKFLENTEHQKLSDSDLLERIEAILNENDI